MNSSYRIILLTLLGLIFITIAVYYSVISSDNFIENYVSYYHDTPKNINKAETSGNFTASKASGNFATLEASVMKIKSSVNFTAEARITTTEGNIKLGNSTKTIETVYKRFVISHSYWEQQTNAVLNMWSLQKWAKKSGNFSVVEPFACNSTLGVSDQNIRQHNFNTSLRFRDYFDLDCWTKGAEKYKVPPLVGWNDFIKHASRSIHLAVFVNNKHRGVFEGDNIKNNPGCVSEVEKFRTILESMLGFLGFKVEKVVCICQKFFKSLKAFNSPFDLNSNTTIYFTLWRGIGERIAINDKTLHRKHETDMIAKMLPSARIFTDSMRYVKTVLNADVSGYTAIVFRMVKRLQVMEQVGFDYAEVVEHYYDCIRQLPDILKQHGTKPFLAIDLGRFGDQTNRKVRTPEFSKMFQHLVNMVYGNKTVSEYEEDFITATNGTSDTGYVGTVQKAIAMKAKCIVMIGGFSNFQNSIMVEFNKDHDCITELCYGYPLPPKTSSPSK